MIRPEEILVLRTESAILGYIIKMNDSELLGKLRDSLFICPEAIALFNYLKAYGIAGKLLLQNGLNDHKMGYLCNFVEICLEDVKDITKDSLEEHLWSLEEAEMKRNLCRISNDIQDELKNGCDSYDLRGRTEKGLSRLYYSSLKVETSKESGIDKIMKILSDTPIFGVFTGLKNVDKKTGGIAPGGIVSVGGVTKNMKTTSTISLILSILKTNPKYKALFFQVEMKENDMALWLLGQSGINRNDYMSGKITPVKVKELLSANGANNRFKFYTSEKNNIRNFAQIEKIITRERPKIWAIDYLGQLVLNEVSFYKEKKESHNIQFSFTMDSIKRLCQRTESICFLIHQANFKNIKSRSDIRPTIGDIEYSSDVSRLSNFVYMCYYPIFYMRRDIDEVDTTKLRRLFFQIWEIARYGEDNVTILEVDPSTGIFSEPCEEVYRIGKQHWNLMNQKAEWSQKRGTLNNLSTTK